jgi:serine/threonine protein kinase
MIDALGNAKVMDFGIAKISGSQLTQTGVYLGTPSYSSPEQVIEGRVDARSDVFSLGILAHECLTGFSPFPGSTLTNIIYKIAYDEPAKAPNLADLPIDHGMWDEVFRKVLSKNPEERFQTAAEFGEALRGCYQLSDGTFRRMDQTMATARSVATTDTMHVVGSPLSQPIKRSEYEQTVAPPPPVSLRRRRSPWPWILIPTLVLLFGFGLLVLKPSWAPLALQKVLIPFNQQLFPAQVATPASSPDEAEKTPTTTVPESKPITPPNHEPDPQPSASFTVEVSSLPSGARVFDQQTELGETPLSLTWSENRWPLRLTLKKQGYRDASILIQKPDEQATGPLKQMVTLESNIRDIRVSSSPLGAKVFDGERLVGTTPFSLQWPGNAALRLRFEAQGFEDRIVTYGTSDLPGEVKVTLKAFPQPGRLVLPNDTLAKGLRVVNQKGKQLQLPLELNPGTYRFTLFNPQYFYEASVEVTIQEQEELLLPLPPLVRIAKLSFQDRARFSMVKINGKWLKRKDGEKEYTPILDVVLPMLEHEFEFVADDGTVVFRKKVSVRDGMEILVPFGL